MADRERIAELADAALRVVMRDGLGAVSFRSVAAESGWSLGAVQKAFASKHDLLEAVVARAQEGVGGGASAPPGEPDLVTWLVELMLRMLPLDEARRAAVLVGTAYAERAAVDPIVGAEVAGRDAALRGQLSGLFAGTRAAGGHASALSDDDLASVVLALAAGLTQQSLYEPRGEPELRRFLHDVLDRMLQPAPRS